MKQGSRCDLWKINGSSVCIKETYHTRAVRNGYCSQVATIQGIMIVISSPESKEMKTDVV